MENSEPQKDKTIYIGADHAGFPMKEMLKRELASQGFDVQDLGARSLDPEDDYPEFGYAVGKAVVANPGSRGIVLCGNAQGICIVANKVRGVRAATGFNAYAAETSRTDDDANVLCLPGRVLSDAEAKEITRIWLSTPFSNAERHVRRVREVEEMEKKEIEN